MQSSNTKHHARTQAPESSSFLSKGFELSHPCHYTKAPQVQNKSAGFCLYKVGTRENTSDLGTKVLDWQVICHLCALAGLEFRSDEHELTLKV